MTNIFFVHIPKTAGTSLRKSAEEYFGSGHVCYDYAPSSKATSEIIKTSINSNEDHFGLYREILNSGIRFLSGHVPANKYTGILGVQNTATFFRDPVQRIFSSYQHVTHKKQGRKESEGDFESFYRSKENINKQYKMMRSVPLKALGFAGITEYYDSCVNQINAAYNIGLKVKTLNQRRPDINQGYDLTDSQYEEIKQLNKKDMTIYQDALKIYQQRYELFTQGLPYVHGDIQQLSSEQIAGWAWYAQSEKPVDVEILVNGQIETSLSATDLCPRLLRLKPPRLGYVGFQHTFRRPQAIGADVMVRVAETGQVLAVSQIGSEPVDQAI